MDLLPSRPFYCDTNQLAHKRSVPAFAVLKAAANEYRLVSSFQYQVDKALFAS